MQSACNQVALSRFVPHAHQRAQHVAGRAPFANQTQSDAIKRTSELNTLPVESHLLRLFGRLELALARLLEMGERCAEIVDLLLELHLVLTKRDELLARPRHLPRVNRRLQLEAISRNQSQSPAARPSPHICVREGRNQQSQSPVGPPPMCPSPLAIRCTQMQSVAITCRSASHVSIAACRRHVRSPCTERRRRENAQTRASNSSFHAAHPRRNPS